MTKDFSSPASHFKPTSIQIKCRCALAKLCHFWRMKWNKMSDAQQQHLSVAHWWWCQLHFACLLIWILLANHLVLFATQMSVFWLSFWLVLGSDMFASCLTFTCFLGLLRQWQQGASKMCSWKHMAAVSHLFLHSTKVQEDKKWGQRRVSCNVEHGHCSVQHHWQSVLDSTATVVLSFFVLGRPFLSSLS